MTASDRFCTEFRGVSRTGPTACEGNTVARGKGGANNAAAH